MTPERDLAIQPPPSDAETIIIGNPNFQAIPLNELYVSDYQRTWSKEQSDRIALNFSMEAFGNLHVMRTGPHSYEILDGQHRYMSLRRMGYNENTTLVVCQVFEPGGDYAPNAPAIFVGLNTNRRPLKPVERLKARIEAREPEALKIKQLVDDAGLELWSGKGRIPPGTIGAIVTLEGLYKRDGYDKTLDLLLRVKSYWGDDNRAWRHPIMVGLRHFLRHYQGRINDDHLHAVMNEQDPGGLTRRGQAIAEAMGGGQLEYGIGRAIAALYNEHLRSGAGVTRLPTWEIGRAGIGNVPRDELRERAGRLQRGGPQGGAFQKDEAAATYKLSDVELPRQNDQQEAPEESSQ